LSFVQFVVSISSIVCKLAILPSICLPSLHHNYISHLSSVPLACANRLDIAFVIDGSSSTTQQNKNRNFGFIRHFLENFVSNLGISYTGVRVSFIVFSNYASVRMTLDQTWDLKQVEKVR
jgi:hypothetical protein